VSEDNRLFYASDCLHFRGDIPCKPHKQFGVHCSGCEHYLKSAGRILIIKLGAAGDVLRTTPILGPLAEQYPNHEIWWLTDSPDLVPSQVHKRLLSTWQNFSVIENTSFDVVYCLDKDPHACALASRVDAAERFGYTWGNGRPAPANSLAEHKFVTGLFDDISQEVRKSYPQELLELCGFEWKGQEYIIDAPDAPSVSIPESCHKGGVGPVIGLNTGCGDRWRAREWPLQYWQTLITDLHTQGYRVLLLGGPAEHDKNTQIARETGAIYFGTFPLREFIGVVNLCDVVVTQVTMALHIALALRKRIVLFNNIFNPFEFELYGRGILLQPDKPCRCYFNQVCTNSEYTCMEHLLPVTVLEAINNSASITNSASLTNSASVTNSTSAQTHELLADQAPPV